MGQRVHTGAFRAAGLEITLTSVLSVSMDFSLADRGLSTAACVVSLVESNVNKRRESQTERESSMSPMPTVSICVWSTFSPYFEKHVHVALLFFCVCVCGVGDAYWAVSSGANLMRERKGISRCQPGERAKGNQYVSV